MAGHVIGWWQFDGERNAMAHTLTGQSVRYLGVATPRSCVTFTNSSNRTWLRFEYEDRETRYPLLVEWRNIPGHGRPLVWRIDHDRSARLWRHLNNADAAHPGYGLWRRVDDCVIDAFSCWPSHTIVGHVPTCISFNAGWLNGAWTAKLYRATWCFRPPRWAVIALDPDCPAVPPIDAPAPAPWRCFAACESNRPDPLDPASWESEPSNMARDVARLTRALPHMMTADGGKWLVALPRHEGLDPKVDERPPVYRARLLYTDNDFITDALIADIGKTSGPNLPEWTVDQGTGLTVGPRSRADGKPIAPIRTKPNHPTLDLTTGHPPNWMALRLAHSLIDARLSHQELGVDFTAKSSEAISAFAEGDPAMLSIDIGHAGGLTHQRLYAGTTLLEPREGALNALSAHLFDEERDGIVRASAPVATVGYWSYDPETRSLVNRRSDQRLQFVGKYPLEGTDNSKPARNGGQSWRFLYRDSIVQYPLLVRSEVSLWQRGLDYKWHIDHVASANLWRGQHNDPAVPAYGLWKRVDSCALDALLCWPEIDWTGPAPDSIEIHGGWCNGGWAGHLRRAAYRGGNWGFDPPDEQTEPPFIEALDALAPAWTFVDVEGMAGRADLAGVREIAPGQYFLPHDSPLTGFQRQMPHLLRNDGKAVIFPAGCRGERRSHDFASTWFVYADEEIFFFFAGKARNPYWHLYLAGGDTPSCVGLRHESRFDPGQPGGLPADLFVQRKSLYSSDKWISLTKNPSPSVAHRVTTALLDAGLIWQREKGAVYEVPERIVRQRPAGHGDPKDWERVDIAPGDTIIVDGGYIGGLFSSNYSIRATLAKG